MSSQNTSAGQQGNAPEFHAEAHPPGTAPAKDSYKPQPTDDIPAQGVAGATASMPGSTSADVHQGLGHPGQGMTSQELHGGKRERGGQERSTGSSLEDSIGSRKLDIGHENRGKGSTEYPAAQDREPVDAEQVASGRA